MSKPPSAASTLLFAAVVCLACSLVVTGSRVLLRSRQLANSEQHRQRNVLVAAGLAEADERLSATAINERFAPITALVWDTVERRLVDGLDRDQVQLRPQMVPAPDGAPGLREMPRHLVLYRLPPTDDQATRYVLPVWGRGLWSMLYAYLTIDTDGVIHGVSFYEQQETPGLGGEISNPRWAATWEGVRAYDDDGTVIFSLVGSTASGPERQVMTLTGATLTSRGVNALVRYWLGPLGYRRLLLPDEEDPS